MIDYKNILRLSLNTDIIIENGEVNEQAKDDTF